ncbi:MAG TPA: YceI family protein [Thermoanaerobaculia bacterium]|nr:YceI family protein [Thermoanaerobaculia bacterium]HUM29259.1 YceI family protein [Thermoanaerobaculia bacterium]HXK67783.1 YceI family protein [Thermoanaerobaculia bacterium]
MKRIFSTLFVALAFLSIPLFASDTYSLDSAHSSIEFGIKHMVISTVKGSFSSFDVSVQYDPKEVAKSSVEVSIQTDTINTGNEKRDEHLKSPDFFDTKTYPAITFKSKRIAKKGDSYEVTGDFTMHGVTKEITFPFTVMGPIKDPWGNMRLGVEAYTTLNRQEYGVSWNKTLDTGGLVVGDDVKVEIHLELVKAQEKAS